MPDDANMAAEVSAQGPGNVPGRNSWTPSEFAFAARRAPPPSENLRAEYHALLAEMVLSQAHASEINRTVDRIVASRSRYEEVERQTSVKWYVVATIHNLEASLRFDCHLHNGDPLTARTVHVPAGRPKTGTPPFTWEASAADALAYDGFTTNTDWSPEKVAYLLGGLQWLGLPLRTRPT